MMGIESFTPTYEKNLGSPKRPRLFCSAYLYLDLAFSSLNLSLDLTLNSIEKLLKPPGSRFRVAALSRVETRLKKRSENVRVKINVETEI